MVETRPDIQQASSTSRARSIVLLVASLERDGAETQLVLLARRLQLWGWRVRIVAMLPIDGFGGAIDDLDVEYLGMTRSGLNPGALGRFWRMMRTERPAALVSFTYPANIFGRVVGRACGIPVIVSSIRVEKVGGRAKEMVLRLTSRLDSLTTTNSSAVGASLARRRLVVRDRLRVTPNGIDLSPFAALPERAADVRAELGAEPEAFVWLAVGRLVPAKDFPNLLEALRLLQGGPAHRVYVAGGGPLHEALERQAEAMGLEGRVTFLGRREDVPRLLSAADALVLPSAQEGMPNVLMEALAAGRPGVATDVGGVREVMVDGASGYVVPSHQPRALAEAMARLMAQPPEARAAMGAAGRAHVESTFSVTAMAERWRTLLVGELGL